MDNAKDTSGAEAMKKGRVKICEKESSIETGDDSVDGRPGGV